jgi:hypothetical protein
MKPISYFKILDYLEQNWGNTGVAKFVNKTNKVLDNIKRNPEMFQYSSKKHIRIGFLTKQTSLF